MGQFSSSPGAIYPALHRLEERKLLRSESEDPSRVRARRVYHPTPEGEEVLLEWVRESVTVSELRNRPSEPFLRLTFAGGRLSPEEMQGYLAGFRRAIRAILDELESQRRDFVRDGASLPGLVLEHGIDGYRTTLEWIDRAEALLVDPDGLDGVLAELRSGRPSAPTESPS